MSYHGHNTVCRQSFGRVIKAYLLGGTVFAAAVFPLHAAHAQDNTGIAEIVVTAQKTEERLSKVPVTISALTGDQLLERNYFRLEDFKGAVPGLQVNDYVGETRINIRGLGMNSLSFGVDSQIALNMNGVFIANAFGADQAFLDIERIEVLRGPQGTLYGRNATGGAINIISKRPTETFEGFAQLTYGNYNRVNSQFVASGPLMGDKILGRIAVTTEDHSGYSLNLIDGKKYDDARRRAVRGTLLFNLSDSVTLDVVGDYSRGHDGSAATHLFGTSPGFPTFTGVVLGGHTVPLTADGQAIDPRLLSINSIPDYHQYSGGVSGDLTWTINDNFSLKSLTAYRKNRVSFPIDFDQTETPFPSGVPGKDFQGYNGSEQISQELQVNGKLDWLKFVAGLYYFHDNIDPAFFKLGINVATPATPFNVHLQLGGTTKTNAYAAYGQATASLTDQLSFTAGVRYSHEKRSSTSLQIIPEFGLTQTDAQSATFHDVSPKFTVDYQWTDDFMTYVTVSKGFKSGGFDISASPPLARFAPETIWDYEGGAKLKMGWGTVDVSGFHYDYKNLQLAQIVNGLPNTTNAGSSDVNGVELAFTVKPTAQLTLTTALAYLDAKFNNVTENDTLTGLPTSLRGNRLPGSSKYSSNVSLQYDIPIGENELTLQGEWNWHDRLYFTEFNSKQVSQGAVSTLNALARYTFADRQWYVEVYGKNLTDRLIASQKWITGAGFGAMVIGNLEAPRTFGATVHYTF